MCNKEPVVTTKAGKLRGSYIDGIYRFLGVHYADAPEGEYRFMPPRPLTPWEGEKLAQEYVAKCWQHDHPRVEDVEVSTTKMFQDQQKLMVRSSEMGTGRQTEDCLAVNVWTQGLNDGKKRPVMVWFHGGGDFAGAAEADWHDGYNMAKNQDIVMVTVGHRLAVFGYINLTTFGEKYKDSVNLGHQDMVAALQWIHDNIEQFGGDPGNVTLFGQSGGGGKVCALMGMPAAKGLFQRAIVQSGGFHPAAPEAATKLTKEFMDFLGIDEEHVDDLQKFPPEALIQAIRDINKTKTLGTYMAFPSVRDGKHIVYNPFDGAEGSEYSKDIDLISGYTKDDGRLQLLFDQSMLTYSIEEAEEHIAQKGYTPEEAKKIIGIYKGMLGEDANGCDIYTAFLNDQSQLKENLVRFKAREKVGAKPMYNYVFGFEGPYPDMKAIHGVDVPFFFDNGIYAQGIWTADTRVGAMKLSTAAGAAWASFARCGNPSCPEIGVWKAYDDKDRYTMFFDVDSHMVKDYRGPGLKVALKDF